MNNNQPNTGTHSCTGDLDMIRALDFAIQETVLYLDAYPYSTEALAYYHRLIEKRRAACEHYERHCGPLTYYGNVSTTSWDWTMDPWPWEPEAN